MPIIDDFDQEDDLNGAREVSLASTKLVVGQHVRILAERLMMNMQVGRQDDELACVQNMLEVLTKYLQIVGNHDELVTEEILKRELEKVYDSRTLLTPDELAKQLEELRAKSNTRISPDDASGLD